MLRPIRSAVSASRERRLRGRQFTASSRHVGMISTNLLFEQLCEHVGTGSTAEKKTDYFLRPPILHHQMTPPACPAWGWGRIGQLSSPGLSSMGVGSNWTRCSSRPEHGSVLRVRADCGGRLFTAKLGVVVHYLHASNAQSLAAGSSYPDGSAGTVGRVQRFKDAIA